MSKIRVAVVEDDARLRRVVAEVFQSADDCQCVGTFADGKNALAGLPAIQPDVIVMDVNLPDTSGVECVAWLAPKLPQTQILMLTVYQDPDTIFRALAAGAHGYLVKPVMPDKLLSAVREIRAGGVPMSRTIARKVIDAFRQPVPHPPAGTAVDDLGLSAREQQVLDLLVAGYSYKEIADQIAVKTSTIGTYVQRIYEKLHVRSRRELVLWRKGALNEGST